MKEGWQNRVKSVSHPTEPTPIGPVLNIAANSTIGDAGEDQTLSLQQGICILLLKP
jgi:hypothetical protein